MHPNPTRTTGIDLADLHEHRTAELSALATEVMDRLGIPKSQQGIVEVGPAARDTTGAVFTFDHEPPQGGRNTRPGRQPAMERARKLEVKKSGINVDSGVLDDNLLPLESWRKADLATRMEVVVAHEIAEFHSPGSTGQWRHADALVQAAKNPRLSAAARGVLEDHFRLAVAGGDPTLAGSLQSARIHQMLQAVANRRGQ
jgi:hypothetical protein